MHHQHPEASVKTITITGITCIFTCFLQGERKEDENLFAYFMKPIANLIFIAIIRNLYWKMQKQHDDVQSVGMFGQKSPLKLNALALGGEVWFSIYTIYLSLAFIIHLTWLYIYGDGNVVWELASISGTCWCNKAHSNKDSQTLLFKPVVVQGSRDEFPHFSQFNRNEHQFNSLCKECFDF